MKYNKRWLTTEKIGNGIFCLSMALPPVNAYEAQDLNELVDTLEEMEKDRDVRALVLTSSLSTFCAGMNLKKASNFTSQEQKNMFEATDLAVSNLFAFKKPLIAQINGPAIAGGFFLVLCADYRIATPNATFALAEVKVGVSLPFSLMEVSRSMIDANSLRRMLQLGSSVSSDLAYNSGIIDEIVDTDIISQRTLEIASEFANLPRDNFTKIKMQIRNEVIEQSNLARLARTVDPAYDWFGSDTKAAISKIIS